MLETPNTDETSAVILMRLPGRERPLGLLVEALGDNPEVPSDRLLPVAVLEKNTTSLLVEYAIQPISAQDGLVLVIAAEQLDAQLFGTPVSVTPTDSAGRSTTRRLAESRSPQSPGG